MDKTILVTGGSGYVGQVVCQRLIEEGYAVINVDRSGIKVKGATNFGYDIENYHQMQGLLELSKPDAIIHLAGSPSAPKSVVNPTDTYQNNVANSINLAKAAISTGVQYFIFSSTSSVYGGTDTQNVEGDAKLETSISPYGRSKYMIERILYDFANAHDFYPVCLRYFNAAGTYKGLGYKKNPKEHVLPILCEKAVKNEEFTIYGDDYNTEDGTCERDYTHVLDVANAHVSALKWVFENNKGTALNIGCGSPVSVKRLVELVKEKTGNDFPVVIGERRAGDPDRSHADISRAMDTLDWAPENYIDKIVEDEVEWALINLKKNT